MQCVRGLARVRVQCVCGTGSRCHVPRLKSTEPTRFSAGALSGRRRWGPGFRSKGVSRGSLPAAKGTVTERVRFTRTHFLPPGHGDRARRGRPVDTSAFAEWGQLNFLPPPPPLLAAQVLMWSYAFAFFLPQAHPNRRLLEQQQGDLERYTNHVHSEVIISLALMNLTAVLMNLDGTRFTCTPRLGDSLASAHHTQHVCGLAAVCAHLSSPPRAPLEQQQ